MKVYSITKYSDDETIKKNDWISVSDIGGTFNGVELTLEKYKAIEDSYVNAIRMIAEYMGLESFRVKKVNKWMDLKSEVNEYHYKELYDDNMLQLFEQINDSSVLTSDELLMLVRLLLREDIYAIPYVSYRFKIFICYDYLMTVHSSKELEGLFDKMRESGLNPFRE